MRMARRLGDTIATLADIIPTPILFIVFVALLISRQPHVLTDAQLWGDDGWSWYPDAYRYGAGCLAMPVNGYLNTLQRLVGLAVQPLPLKWVPIVFAAVGLSVQSLTAAFLCSRRLAAMLPRTGAIVVAVLVLLLPNEIELYGNLTNAQWNLAVLAALVVMAPAARTQLMWAFDVVVLALSGLSGPFALLLAPVALWVWWRRRAVAGGRAASIKLAFVVAIAAVQAAVLLAIPHHGNLPTALGAGVMPVARMVVRHVLVGVELGYQAMMRSPDAPLWQGPAPTLLAVAVGIAVLGWAIRISPDIYRGFTAFALLVVAGSLIHPHASATIPQWEALGHPPVGNRYFAMLSIAWLAGLVVLAGQRQLFARAVGILLLIPVLTYAIPQSWRIESWHTDFAAKARAWDVAPPGTTMAFPLVPPGNGTMVLTRH